MLAPTECVTGARKVCVWLRACVRQARVRMDGGANQSGGSCSRCLRMADGTLRSIGVGLEGDRAALPGRASAMVSEVDGCGLMASKRLHGLLKAIPVTRRLLVALRAWLRAGQVDADNSYMRTAVLKTSRRVASSTVFARSRSYTRGSEVGDRCRPSLKP